MANFDPPQNHWAADFDARLISSLHYLKDEVDRLQQVVRELERKDAERDAALAQAVRDMKFYVEGK